MNIGLDFDGTYTEMPNVWDKFIVSSREEGHRVYIVTFRDPEDRHPAMDYLTKYLDVPIVFTSRNPKKRFCEEMGLDISIWIDDNPDLIIFESEWTDADLLVWRQQEKERVTDEVVEHWKRKEASCRS